MRHINDPQRFNTHRRARSLAAGMVALHLLVWLAATDTVAAAEGLSGKAFYEWSYDAAGDTSEGYNEFAFSRFYLTYERKVSQGMSVRLTTDIARPGSAWSVFQKIASLRWSSGVGDWIIGLQGMNIWNVLEATWGYRFLEKTPMHLHRFASSADLGLGYKRGVGERLHLHLTLTNGPGFKHAENDKYKKIAAQVVYGPTDLGRKEGFNVGAVVSVEPYLATATSASGTPSTPTRTKSLLALFGGLATGIVRAGAEFDRYADSGTGPSQQILAAYANVQVNPRLAAFGRVDIYDPNSSHGGSGDECTYVILGLDYAATELFHIAPNFRFRSAEGNPSGEAGLASININVEFRY